MVLHANTFMRRCFYTGMLLYKKELLHTDTWALLHADAFTQRFFYRGVLLHARAFTRGFFWHKLVFTHRRFYIKCSHTDMFFTQKKHVYKGVFLDTYTFTKRIFARILLRTDAFTYRCLYTRTHLGRGTLTWVRLESTTWGRVQAMWESKRCF